MELVEREIRALTYSQAVAEVVHAVPHDHHPGNAGDTSVLHLLVRVAVSSVGVAVAVGVPLILGLLLLLLGRRGVGVGNGEPLARGRVGCLDLCELCVVVAVVTGTGAVFRVWRRVKSVMAVRRSSYPKLHFCYFTSIERLKVQPLCI